MNGRRIVIGTMAALAATGLIGATGPAAQAAPAAHGVPAAAARSTDNPAGTVRALMSANGFQALIDSVTRQVHAQYPNAELKDAVGTSPSGPTTSVTDVTRWDFLFNDVIGGTDHIIVKASLLLPSWTALVFVQHNAGVYAKTLAGPVAMSPFQATLRRRLAGYQEPFTKMVYAQPYPLMAPHPFPNPVFIFYSGADPTTTVDTVTRVVEPWGA